MEMKKLSDVLNAGFLKLNVYGSNSTHLHRLTAARGRDERLQLKHTAQTNAALHHPAQ